MRLYNWKKGERVAAKMGYKRKFLQIFQYLRVQESHFKKCTSQTHTHTQTHIYYKLPSAQRNLLAT